MAGFTSMAKEVEPEAVMTFLNQLFTLFDKLCDTYGVQKVETAGVNRVWNVNTGLVSMDLTPLCPCIKRLLSEIFKITISHLLYNLTPVG